MKPNHHALAMAHPRQTAIDYLIHNLDIRGKDADAILRAAPTDTPPTGWQRSFAITNFARLIESQIRLERWQCEGAANYLLFYDPRLGGIPVEIIRQMDSPPTHQL